MSKQSKLTNIVSKFTKLAKRPELREQKEPGYKPPNPTRRDSYFNPVLTVPPRSPRTPEDFRYPQRLGHWFPLGFDWTNPVRDKYLYHEFVAVSVFSAIYFFWLYYYSPDFKLKDWARREAILRTTKREALGLPLIDRHVVDPERIVLPTEEELKDYPFKITF